MSERTFPGPKALVYLENARIERWTHPGSGRAMLRLRHPELFEKRFRIGAPAEGLGTYEGRVVLEVHTDAEGFVHAPRLGAGLPPRTHPWPGEGFVLAGLWGGWRDPDHGRVVVPVGKTTETLHFLWAFPLERPDLAKGVWVEVRGRVLRGRLVARTIEVFDPWSL